jgi:hypothetical protein
MLAENLQLEFSPLEEISNINLLTQLFWFVEKKLMEFSVGMSFDNGKTFVNTKITNLCCLGQLQIASLNYIV